MNKFRFFDEFSRRMLVMACIVGLIVSFTLPMTYLFLSLKDAENQANIYGEVLAKTLEDNARINPGLWYYDVPKFVQIVDDMNDKEEVNTVRIYNEHQFLIYEQQIRSPSAFKFVVQSPVHGNNRIVGFVALEYGVNQLAYSVFLLLVAFFLFGIMLAVAIYQYPVITMRKTEAKIVAVLQELEASNKQLEQTNRELEKAQIQIISNEKLASIGQLAAGVAHEINNPLAFVMGNFDTLQGYLVRLSETLDAYEKLQKEVETSACQNLYALSEEIKALIVKRKIKFVRQDLDVLMEDTQDGLRRVRDIVKALQLFSRKDQQINMGEYSLHEGLKNTLVVSRSELKDAVEIKQELGEVPDIEAIGGQINQVLLNILMNAAYAIKGKSNDAAGLITIITSADEEFVYCAISDNGSGMSTQVQKDIFNPFFTTKPVGEGTGLGLSISYDMIVNTHHGQILCESEEGVGTTFTIKLPIKQPRSKEKSDSLI